MGKTKELFRNVVIKFAGLSVLAVVALFLFSSTALRAEAATAKVTASSVRIRKEASTSSDVVGSADNGDTFTIQGEVTGSDGKVWYKVSVDGVTGYIRSDLAQKSESGTVTTDPGTPTTSNQEVTAIQPISAKVTGGQVRVRPDASTNGSVVTTVSKDTVVTVNGMAKGSDNKTWYQVNFRSGSDDITGFIREDFLQLAGEVVPVTEEAPEVPPVEEPSQEIPEVTVKEKDYETYESEGKWYLVNNTTSPAYQYVIEDIFKAAETNADLYEDSLKTIKTQKIFIVILVLLLVAGGVGATFIIFKMKDMLDEAYYEEVEKEVSGKRQNKQQNVMHTVGKNSPQSKPTVNGQAKPQQMNGQAKPAVKTQQVNGQPKQMPKPPVNGAVPRPNTAQTPAMTPRQPMNPQKPVQPKANEPLKTAPIQKPVNEAPKAAPVQPAAKPQPAAPQKPVNAEKPKQDFKSKNFAADDDDFEYDFLNWDGDEEI